MELEMGKPRVTFLSPDAAEFWPTVRVRVDIDGKSYGITASEDVSMPNIWAAVERIITDVSLRKQMDMFHRFILDNKGSGPCL